jgi:hypothetical protein
VRCAVTYCADEFFYSFFAFGKVGDDGELVDADMFLGCPSPDEPLIGS